MAKTGNAVSAKTTRKSEPRSRYVSSSGSISELSMATVNEASIMEKPRSLVVFLADSETGLSPTLQQYMARAKNLRNAALRLIERMRRAAQPNEYFRGQRLTACDAGTATDRAKLIAALNEIMAGTFCDQPVLANYVQEVIEMEIEAEKAQDTFLRQVMVYCVSPLQSYASIDYQAMLKEHKLLEKRRQEYDTVRRRAGKGYLMSPVSSEVTIVELSAMDPRVIRAKHALMDQSIALEKLLDKIPATQMAFAKSIATYVLAEAAYYAKIYKKTHAIKPPNHASRWPTS